MPNFGSWAGCTPGWVALLLDTNTLQCFCELIGYRLQQQNIFFGKSRFLGTLNIEHADGVLLNNEWQSNSGTRLRQNWISPNAYHDASLTIMRDPALHGITIIDLTRMSVYHMLCPFACASSQSHTLLGIVNKK